MAVAPVGKNPLFPLPWMIPDRSSPSRVRFRRFAPWTAAGRSEGMAVYEGKGGGSGRVDGPEGNLFGHTRRLEPQPRGAVTRRAVAQRRSRASGLTRPLAEAIRGFDSGFGLGFVVGPLARSAAVWCKACCFQFFTYKEGFGFAFLRGGGVSPPLPVVSLLFSVSYPQP